MRLNSPTNDCIRPTWNFLQDFLITLNSYWVAVKFPEPRKSWAPRRQRQLVNGSYIDFCLYRTGLLSTRELGPIVLSQPVFPARIFTTLQGRWRFMLPLHSSYLGLAHPTSFHRGGRGPLLCWLEHLFQEIVSEGWPKRGQNSEYLLWIIIMTIFVLSGLNNVPFLSNKDFLPLIDQSRVKVPVWLILL